MRWRLVGCPRRPSSQIRPWVVGWGPKGAGLLVLFLNFDFTLRDPGRLTEGSKVQFPTGPLTPTKGGPPTPFFGCWRTAQRFSGKGGFLGRHLPVL